MEPDFAEKERKIGGRVIIETLYNDIRVFVDKETGYYYAGVICSDNKKRFEHLAENQDYEAYKQAVSSTTGIPVVELELIFEGMPVGYRSKWIHPLLVHTVCEWADKKYAVQVSLLMNEKAKQALIEKKTLQEQIDREHRKTERLEDDLNNALTQRDDIQAKLDELKTSFDNFRAESEARDQQAHQERQQLIAQNEHTHQELEHANAQRDELQTAVNGLQNTVDKLHDVIVDSGQMLHDTVQAARDTVLERFTQANVTTSSRLETIDVWRIKELDDYYHRIHQCQENESVLDTFCGDASKPSRINQHRFKPKEDDEFIGSYPNANAIDLALYLRHHHDEYPHVRMDKNRKLIYSDNELDEVRNLLLAYSQNGDGVIRAVVHGFETKYQEASDSLINRLQTALQPIIQNQNQILANQQAHHQEQMQAVANAEANINANIDNAVNEVEEHIDEALAPIIALFYQLHPNATQVYYNHAYRLIIIQNDKIYCHILKSSNQLMNLQKRNFIN